MQTAHAAPEAPQAAFVLPDWQMPLVSTQAAQVHELLMQDCEDAAEQTWHAAPPLPHAVLSVPV